MEDQEQEFKKPEIEQELQDALNSDPINIDKVDRPYQNGDAFEEKMRKLIKKKRITKQEELELRRKFDIPAPSEEKAA